MRPGRLVAGSVAPALALVAALLAPVAASAVPHDYRLELKTGEEKFARLYDVEDLAATPPGVVDVEVLPSQEVRFEGRAPGEARVIAVGQALMRSWRVTVREPGTLPPKRVPLDPALLAAARLACGRVVETFEEKTPVLEADVPDEKCRKALHALLLPGTYAAGDLRLLFRPEALQGQLVALEAAAKAAKVAQIVLVYRGASLSVRGQLTKAERTRLFAALYEVAVGRVPMDDGLELRDDPAATETPTAPTATLPSTPAAGEAQPPRYPTAPSTPAAGEAQPPRYPTPPIRVMTIDEARQEGIAVPDAPAAPDGGTPAPRNPR